MGHLARGHVKSEVCTLRAVGGTKLEPRERSGFRDAVGGRWTQRAREAQRPQPLEQGRA